MKTIKRKKRERDLKINYAVRSRGNNRMYTIKGCRTSFSWSLGIWLLAAALAVPGRVQAQEETSDKLRALAAVSDGRKVERELHHIHIGNKDEGSGCYTKDIVHVHEGNPSEGGICYSDPIYHEHTGNETAGGGCYGEKNYHVHEGNEAEGGGCYKTPHYHVHEGNTLTGGICFETPVYHTHDGNETRGGICYQTPVYHVHSGSAAAGGGCYQEAVCHSHAGSAVKGGGCYGAAVYHTHAGSASKGGGCYGQTVYHSHTGSGGSGGGCYGKAVYHIHTGSPLTGGGCYTVADYHSHIGNDIFGGDCYSPVNHTHTDACYTMDECTATYEGGLQIVNEYDEYCHHHDATLHVKFEGDFQHQNCGLGKTRESKTICWACKKMDKTHEYQKEICGKDETVIEGYVLSCGKGTDTVDAWRLGCNQNETTIMGYEINCGKNTATIDAYQMNCGKNEKSVESYRRSCGKTESTVESYKRNCKKAESTVDAYRKSCPKDEKDIDAYEQSCKKTAQMVEKYERDCGKKEETIDSYARNCERDGTFIDAYALSCQKTDKMIDGYELGCNKEEETACAVFSLWNTESEWTNGPVVLRAVCEAKSGFLRLEKDPFLWEDAYADEVENEGSKAENGTAKKYKEKEYSNEKNIKNNRTERISDNRSVEENGVYAVRLMVESEDIAEREPVLSIEVRNIDKTAPLIREITYNKEPNVQKNEICVVAEDIQPDGGDGSGLPQEAYSFDGGKTWVAESIYEVRENGIVDIAVRDFCGNIANERVQIENIRENRADDDSDEDGSENEDKKDDGSGDDNDKDDGDSAGHDSGDNDDKNEPDKENPPKKKAERRPDIPEEKKMPGKDKPSVRKRDEDTKEIKPKEVKLPQKKEEEMVKLPEVKAMPVSNSQLQTAKKKEVMAPVVKAITFTVSGVAFTAVLLYLLYMMFRSIKVYHQDGEGGSRYAGSCMMKKTENGFEVKLPDMILEQSTTGQFVMRPSGIFAVRYKGEELMVLSGRRKESVWIDREIPLKLTTFV